MTFALYYNGSQHTTAVNFNVNLILDGIDVVTFQVPQSERATWESRIYDDVYLLWDTTSIFYGFVADIKSTITVVTITCHGIIDKMKWYVLGPDQTQLTLTSGVIDSVDDATTISCKDEQGEVVAFTPDYYIGKYLVLEDSTIGDTILDCTTTDKDAEVWAAGTNYVVGDLVTVGGDPYVAIADGINHLPPNADYWATGIVGYDYTHDGDVCAGTDAHFEKVGQEHDESYWKNTYFADDTDYKEMFLYLNIGEYEIAKTAKITKVRFVGSIKVTTSTEPVPDVPFAVVNPAENTQIYFAVKPEAGGSLIFPQSWMITYPKGNVIATQYKYFELRLDRTMNYGEDQSIVETLFHKGAVNWEQCWCGFYTQNKHRNDHGDSIKIEWDALAVEITYTTANFDTINLVITGNTATTIVCATGDFIDDGVSVSDNWTVCKSYDNMFEECKTSDIYDGPPIPLTFNNDVAIAKGCTTDLSAPTAYEMFVQLSEQLSYHYYTDYVNTLAPMIQTRDYTEPANPPEDGGTLADFKIAEATKENEGYSAVVVFYKYGYTVQPIPTPPVDGKVFVIKRDDILTLPTAIEIAQKWVDFYTDFHYSIKVVWDRFPAVYPRVGYIYDVTIDGTAYTDQVCRRVSVKNDGASGPIEIEAYFGFATTPTDEKKGRALGLLERKISRQQLTSMASAIYIPPSYHNLLSGLNTGDYRHLTAALSTQLVGDTYDADKLDGQHGSYYLPKTSDSPTLTASAGNLILKSDLAQVQVNSDAADVYINGATKVNIESETGIEFIDNTLDATYLTFDYNAGATLATIVAGGKLSLETGDDFGISVAGLIAIDSSDGIWEFLDDDTEIGRITNGAGVFTISSSVADANIKLDPNGTGKVDVSTSIICNVVDPVNDQDAATKKWVVDNYGGGGAGSIAKSGKTITTNLEIEEGTGTLLLDNTVGDIDLTTTYGDINATAGGNVVLTATTNLNVVTGAAVDFDIATTMNIDVDGGIVYFKDNATEFARLTNSAGAVNISSPSTVTVTSIGVLTLDATTDIVLDADDADIFFKDAGTTIATLHNNAGNFELTAAGTFKLSSTGATTIDASTDIVLDADNAGTITFKDGGTEFGNLGKNASGGLDILSAHDISVVSDEDVNIEGATITLTSTTTTLNLSSASSMEIDTVTTFTVDATTGIVLDSDTGSFTLKDGGTTLGTIPIIKMLDTDPNAWAYSFTSATNGGTVDLDLDNSTSTETNCAQVNDALATYVCPSWATHVLVMVLTSASTINAANGLMIRENGNANAYMGAKVYCGSVAGYINSYEGWIRMDANKVIEVYVMRSAGTISGWIMIKGWGKFDTT